MSDPTPLTLRSLQPYAGAQEKIIESLLRKDPHNPHFRNLDDEDWTRFWNSAWGNPPIIEEEKVARDLHPIDDFLILPDVVPPFRKVLPKPENLDGCWAGFECEKMLIRQEYKEALEFVLATFAKERTFNASIITGQPGIGSSFFTQPFRDLRVFLRENRLLASCPLRASRAQASYYTADWSRGPRAFSQKRGEAAWAAQFWGCLCLIPVSRHPSPQDLGPCGRQPVFARTCWVPQNWPLLCRRSNIPPPPTLGLG